MRRFTRILNSQLEIWAASDIFCDRTRIILAITRLTYGYNKDMVRIPQSRLADVTQIPRGNIHRSLKRLVDSGVVVAEGKGKKIKLGINPDFLPSNMMASCHQIRRQSAIKYDGNKNGPTYYRKTNRKDNRKDKGRTGGSGGSSRSKNHYPEWLDMVVWGHYREHRKAVRSPMTDEAERLVIEELKEMCGSNLENHRSILKQSIRNGWKGIFPITDEEEEDGLRRFLSRHAKDE